MSLEISQGRISNSSSTPWILVRPKSGHTELMTLAPLEPSCMEAFNSEEEAIGYFCNDQWENCQKQLSLNQGPSRWFSELEESQMAFIKACVVQKTNLCLKDWKAHS